VSKVRIEASNNCDKFTRIYEQGIPPNNIIDFPKTIVASVIRIVIVGSEPSNQDSSPIAVNE